MTAFNFQFVCVKQWLDSCNIQFFVILMCEPSPLHLNFVATCRRFERLPLIFNMRKCARKVGRKIHARCGQNPAFLWSHSRGNANNVFHKILFTLKTSDFPKAVK